MDRQVMATKAPWSCESETFHVPPKCSAETELAAASVHPEQHVRHGVLRVPPIAKCQPCRDLGRDVHLAHSA